MQHNWYRTSLCHKVAALVIICSYFILLIFIHDTTYIWATLALVFVLFVTTFSCSSGNTPFLLQLRGSRLTGITNRTIAQENNNEEEQEPTETRIWMTDIPPSYSFIMADITPPTPPPSYGSAILMFPPPYLSTDAKNESEHVGEGSSTESQQLRRPLSISTQVSVSGTGPEAAHLGGITFSTQVSVISTQSEIPQDLALRARFYISRQVSREDATEDSSNKQEYVMGEASARLFVLSRQISREESGEEQENALQHLEKSERSSPLVSRQISKDEYAEGIDIHKAIMKHDLRRRLLLSRQASREERLSSKVVQGQENEHSDNPERSLSRRSSVEEIVENGQKKSDGIVRIVIVQHNSKESASNKERQNMKETERTVEKKSGSTVSVNIPEDLEEPTTKSTE